MLFGGNIGRGNFNGLNFSSYIQNGKLNSDTPNNAMCLIYQTLTGAFPSELGQIVNLPVQVLGDMQDKLLGFGKNFGCPLNPNSGGSVSGSP